jgi:hypothetical protein
VATVLSDDLCRAEVDSILNTARDEVRGLLAARPHAIEALRDALLAREELIGPEITTVLDAAGAGPVVDLRDNEVRPAAPG